MNVSKRFPALIGFAGFIAGSTHAATILGTGWNQDIIVEATATNSAAGIQAVTTTGFTGGFFVLTEQGFAGVGSGTPLPSSGELTTINGTVFQLASYTGNNSFADTVATGIDGTFTLNTPGSYSSLQFFVIGVGDMAAGDNFFATVNFSDASFTLLSFHVIDWQASSVGNGDYDAFTSKTDYARRDGNAGLALWTRELQFPLSVADQAKTITSIDFDLQDRLGVAAVSGEAIPEPASLSVFVLGLAGLCLRRRRRA
jgi:hypothetical protein